MSLTPVPRPVPPALLTRLGTPYSPAGLSATSGDSLLLPLHPDNPDGQRRLWRLVRSMAGDLVARVLLDRWGGATGERGGHLKGQAVVLISATQLLWGVGVA